MFTAREMRMDERMLEKKGGYKGVWVKNGSLHACAMKEFRQEGQARPEPGSAESISAYISAAKGSEPANVKHSSS